MYFFVRKKKKRAFGKGRTGGFDISFGKVPHTLVSTRTPWWIGLFPKRCGLQAVCFHRKPGVWRMICLSSYWVLDLYVGKSSKLLDLSSKSIQKPHVFQNCMMNYTMISHSFMCTCNTYIHIYKYSVCFTYKLLYIHIYSHTYNIYSHATTKCVYLKLFTINIYTISSYNHMLILYRDRLTDRECTQ